MYFDIGKWVMKLIYTNNSYSTLLEFTNDNDTFDTYMHNKSVYIGSEDGELIVNEDQSSKVHFANELKNEVLHAIENYSNQMVIILATYIETMHSDFFESIFIKNNKLIYQYASDSPDKKGYVKVNLIIDSNSKDEIINRLIIVAKKNIVNGSLEKINQKIKTITKYQIDTKLAKEVQLNILNKRNMIIHEAASPMINKNDIDYYFELVEKYLFELGSAAKKYKAPIIDQSNWLNEET